MPIETCTALGMAAMNSCSETLNEAATVLENERSQALLERCGFHREGVARRYLRIDGGWRDHILFARLAEDEL